VLQAVVLSVLRGVNFLGAAVIFLGVLGGGFVGTAGSGFVGAAGSGYVCTAGS